MNSKLLNVNDNIKILNYLLLLFVLDMSGLINLYGENFVRRIINMFRRRDELSYIKKLKPYCQKYIKILDDHEIKQLQSIKIPKTNDIFWFSRKNTTTHQCCDNYSNEEINIINNITNKVKVDMKKLLEKNYII